MGWNNRVSIDELVGKVMKSVKYDGSDIVLFETVDGEKYSMHHDQDCCESVDVREVVGDLNHLVGSPITQAVEMNDVNEISVLDYEPESYTWTYYKFATKNGEVIIKWFGESNGYYGETPDLYKI